MGNPTCATKAALCVRLGRVYPLNWDILWFDYFKKGPIVYMGITMIYDEVQLSGLSSFMDVISPAQGMACRN
jgi:hypothetical protein